MTAIRKYVRSLICAGMVVAILGCGLAPRPTAEPDLELELAPGVQIGVVTTSLGGLMLRDSVDSHEPGGGMWVTIEEVQPGQALTVSWQATTERVIPPEGPTPVVGVGTPAPTPHTEVVTLEGTIGTDRLGDAHSALLPIYWSTFEDDTTDTSLMWLSQEAFDELKRTRQTRWSADVVTQLSNLPAEALAQIADATEGREIYLKAEAEFVDFELSVNGAKARLQAIRAFDDFGNEYLILDDAGNPLIVKFLFNPLSTDPFLLGPVWTLIKAVFSGYQVVEIRQ